MKSVNPWLIAGIIVLSLISFGSWYIFLKPGRNIANETAISIKAEEIYDAYLKNEKIANNIYLDKAIIIRGKISDIKTNQQGQQVIILETGDPIFGVVCTMSQSVTTSKGEFISIKGFCTGYTTDVVLRDCINAAGTQNK